MDVMRPTCRCVCSWIMHVLQLQAANAKLQAAAEVTSNVRSMHLQGLRTAFRR